MGNFIIEAPICVTITDLDASQDSNVDFDRLAVCKWIILIPKHEYVIDLGMNRTGPSRGHIHALQQSFRQGEKLFLYVTDTCTDEII